MSVSIKVGNSLNTAELLLTSSNVPNTTSETVCLFTYYLHYPHALLISKYIDCKTVLSSVEVINHPTGYLFVFPSSKSRNQPPGESCPTPQIIHPDNARCNGLVK